MACSPCREFPDARKRYFDFKQHEHQDPEYRAEIGCRYFHHLFQDTSTKDIFPQYLKLQRHLPLFESLRQLVMGPVSDSQDTSVVMNDETALREKHFALKLARNTKKHGNAAILAKEMLTQGTVRELAAQLKVPMRNLSRLLRSPRKIPLTGKLVKIQDRANVIEFYQRNTISQTLPHKKWSHLYYLRMTLQEAYMEYKIYMRENNKRVLAPTTVRNLLKRFKKFKLLHETPQLACLCDRCENLKLKTYALTARNMFGISRNLSDNAFSSLCVGNKSKSAARKLCFQDPSSADEGSAEKHLSSVEQLRAYDRNCLQGFCKRCDKLSVKQKIYEMNPDVDWNRIVTWHAWGPAEVECQVKKRVPVKGSDKFKVVMEPGVRSHTMKQHQEGTLDLLVSQYCQDLKAWVPHLFHKRWQAEQFEEDKRNVTEGEVIFCMDFGQNIAHALPDEIQSVYWGRKQSTIHPCVTYYKCPACKNALVTDEIVCVSDDLNHDAYAVEAFEKEAITCLRDQGIEIRRASQWCDNCSGHYKGYKSFHSITNRNIPTTRNYFAACHGKGPADQVIGRTVQFINRIRCRAEIKDGVSFVQHCKDRELEADLTHTKCQHFRQHYIYVKTIDRSKTISASTVKNTQMIHCVRSVGKSNLLEARLNSCNCR